MKYLEAPECYVPQEGETSLFLAGGISGCGDWQHDLVRLLEDTRLVVLGRGYIGTENTPVDCV
jgi:hypothetical protein